MKYRKPVLMFPGQGSQKPGMGKDLFDGHDIVKDIYKQASDILGYDVAKLCFEGSNGNGYKVFGTTIKFPQIPFRNNDLSRTLNAQPAIFTTNHACLMALAERHEDALSPFLTMGHSLGEYNALVASGSMDFEDALRLVQKRAEYMSNAVRGQQTGLMSILGLKDKDDMYSIRRECGNYGVYLALVNTPNQIVVGGKNKDLKRLSDQFKKRNIKTVSLNVEGAFHTPMLKYFADEFYREDVFSSNIRVAAHPIIANVTAQAISDPEHIKDELQKQIYSPIEWSGSVVKAIENGADLFIELGPGKTLSGMVKTITRSMGKEDPEHNTVGGSVITEPDVHILNVGDIDSLEDTIEVLAQDQ